MYASNDRNLLFGILALQNDFVTRDQLVEAMHAWVLEKQRPLADLFRARAALGDAEIALLDRQLVKDDGYSERGSLGVILNHQGLEEHKEGNRSCSVFFFVLFVSLVGHFYASSSASSFLKSSRSRKNGRVRLLIIAGIGLFLRSYCPRIVRQT